MILIAGGDGFIGSNLQKVLQSHDIEFEVADLKSGADICEVNGKYDVIVLLAASLDHDIAMYRHNLRIYEWAARQTAQIIYTSSAAVYGDSIKRHSEDEQPLAPTLYGKSKLLGEMVVKDTQQHYTILRLGNVYGHGDGNGVIDIFKRGGNKIYGVGDNIRDYVSVEMVCNAILAILLNPAGYDRQTFNISTGKAKSTKQAFYEFGHGQPEYLPARGFDVSYSVLDNSKAAKAGLL